MNAFYLQDKDLKLYTAWKAMPGNKNKNTRQYLAFISVNSPELQLFLGEHGSFVDVKISSTTILYVKPQ